MIAGDEGERFLLRPVTYFLWPANRHPENKRKVIKVNSLYPNKVSLTS